MRKITSKIKLLKEIKEKGTGYDFLRFWDENTRDDKEYQGYDGGAGMVYSTTKTMKGLCVVAQHFIMRGNNLKLIKLKELINYVQHHDSVFAKRTKNFSPPDVSIQCWTNAVFRGNKKYREQLDLGD